MDILTSTQIEAAMVPVRPEYRIDPVLDLADDSDELADDAETFAASIREVTQRIAAGQLSRDDRTEIGGDMVAMAERLMAYAMRVLA